MSRITVEEVSLEPGMAREPPMPELLPKLMGGEVATALIIRPYAVPWKNALRARIPNLRWIELDIGEPNQEIPPCDVVLLADALAWVEEPAALLQWLFRGTGAHTRIFLSIPNQATPESIAQQLAGETAAPGGFRDLRPSRATAIGSAFKLLLDCGWLPNLCDETHEDADTPFRRALLGAAEQAGVPLFPANRNLHARNPLVDCTKYEQHAVEHRRARPFTVVVPRNNPDQFNLNIAQSPGLREVGAQVVVVAGAPNAATAYEHALGMAQHDWIVYCHQDVYFPAGSGYAISETLHAYGVRAARNVVVGFAGVGENPAGTLAPCGLVIDRRSRLDFGCGSQRAVSIDELAIAMHRNCQFRIAPDLGWHLWATDLCLQSLRAHAEPSPAILQIPVLHNSYGLHPPREFYESARVLRERNPEWSEIYTLSGIIRQPVASSAPDVETLAQQAEDVEPSAEEPSTDAAAEDAVDARIPQTPAHDRFNADLLRWMPGSALRIVEVGASSGALARAYRMENPKAEYVGIEIDPSYVERARAHCTQVIHGDIEQMSDEQFRALSPTDCWVFGDVLEHLYDPWGVLRRIRSTMRPSDCVVACVPNAQHWTVLARLASGNFWYEETGLLDRTHIRFFTRITLTRMFEDCGFRIDAWHPRVFAFSHERQGVDAVRSFAHALGADPEVSAQDAMVFQYVLRAVPAA